MKNLGNYLKIWYIPILLVMIITGCEDRVGITYPPLSSIPTVSSTNPINLSTGVALNNKITATFSEAMDSSTITTATFTLMQGTSFVSGTVSYTSTTATFAPLSNLAPNTTYTATITTMAKNTGGTAIANNYVWIFATGTTAAITAPTVSSTNPVNSATGVPFNQKIAATFSEAMNASTFTTSTFTLMQGTTSVSGIVSYTGTIATFAPTNNLAANTNYTVTITTAVKDLAGNALANNYGWSFTTGTTAGTTSPTVISTLPLKTATGVALNIQVAAIFSEALDPLTITTSTFTLMQGTKIVAGTVSYAGTTATYIAASNLTSNTTYTATITTGVKDLSGNSLNSNYVWTFTTVIPYAVTLLSNPAAGGTTSGAGTFYSGSLVTVTATANAGYTFINWTNDGNAVSTNANYQFTITGIDTLTANFGLTGPAGINLGSAGNFAILAGSGVTNTGASTLIYGDVGSFPTATIDGLLASNVVGTLYTTADSTVSAAKNALNAAYLDAQSRSTNAISLPGQLGGLTLAPGLYVNSSSSGISGTGSNAILTLNAGGNPNAVWIFEMGSTLVTSPNTSIVLSGGASWKNVYWSVGTSATLGTNSIFYGNILSQASITINTGATLYGRALTQTAEVTLQANTVDSR
jgi:hypothetical protein